MLKGQERGWFDNVDFKFDTTGDGAGYITEIERRTHTASQVERMTCDVAL